MSDDDECDGDPALCDCSWHDNARRAAASHCTRCPAVGKCVSCGVSYGPTEENQLTEPPVISSYPNNDERCTELLRVDGDEEQGLRHRCRFHAGHDGAHQYTAFRGELPRVDVPRGDHEAQISISRDLIEAIVSSVQDAFDVSRSRVEVRELVGAIATRAVIETVDALEAEGWCGLDFHVNLPAGDGEICSYCEKPHTEHPRVPVCIPDDPDDPHRAAILDAMKGIFLP